MSTPLNEYLRRCARDKVAPVELTVEDGIALVELLDAVENACHPACIQVQTLAAMRRIRGR